MTAYDVLQQLLHCVSSFPSVIDGVKKLLVKHVQHLQTQDHPDQKRHVVSW